MSLFEDLQRAHKQRLARIASRALPPKPAAPKAPAAPPALVETPKDWVKRQITIHKAPWFEIVDGPREFRPGPVRIETIKRLVCEHYGISEIDLISARRAPIVAFPRQVVCYLSKRFTPKSFPEIARKLGDRDHTSIMHAIRKIERLLLTDERLQASVELLTEKLGATTDSERRPRAILNEERVREIRASKEPAAVLAKRFRVSRFTIDQCRKGKTWGNVK